MPSKKVGFEQQLAALQGLWAEVQSRGKSRGKLWLVQDAVATHQVSPGSKGKRFKLKEGENGELLWGGGQYVLDPAFKKGEVIASWYNEGETSGKILFSWHFQGQASSSKEKPVMKMMAQLSKAHAETAAEERRIDPSDKKAYTKEEMRYYYSNTFTKKGFEDHWASCKVDKPPAPERRIDPTDGWAYTKEEMKAFYSNTYTKKGLDIHWEACPIAYSEAEERRIDPADGKAYTWKEMKQHYSSIYTTKYLGQFWSECKKAD